VSPLGSASIVLSKRKGRPVGTMSVTPADAGGFHVTGITVPKEARRQGIATKLFEVAAKLTGGPRRETVSTLTEAARKLAQGLLDKGRTELVDADALAADVARMKEIRQ